MKNYKEIINREIMQQKSLLKKYEQYESSKISGYLRTKKRTKYNSYYWVRLNASGKYSCTNITRNRKQIAKLLRKAVAKEGKLRTIQNLSALNELAKVYAYSEEKEIINSLSPSYTTAYKELFVSANTSWANSPYDQAPFDPKRHIHETISGYMVSSKSEVIIANALTQYGIPFHYEEKLSFPDEDGNFHYPDFVIRLPSGQKIYWEHFGMLSKMIYCDSNARKLYIYQRNGLVIGKDLIITQDDNRGSCNSQHIHEVIINQLLPYFN